MSLKNAMFLLLNFISFLRLRYRGMSVSLGSNSRASLWRIIPSENSIFKLGDHSLVSTNIVFERPNARVDIGDRTFIGGKGVISVSSSIDIGSDVLISWGCTITDHDSHSLTFSERSSDVVAWIAGRKDWTKVRTAPVRVSDKAWLGFNCSILKGVTIGEGAVIAANSNVTKDVPSWTLAGGNPAKTIRKLTPE